MKIFEIKLNNDQVKVAKTQTRDVSGYLQRIINAELANIEIMVVGNIIYDMDMEEKKLKMGIDLRNFERKEDKNLI